MKRLLTGILSQGGFDSITRAYVGRMTTKPSYAHQVLINDFVKATKSIIAKADVIYLGNINDSNDSFINLVKNAHHGTIQGSGLVFDNLVGFTNPAGTGWVDTNYNPATQGVKYTLNDAGAGVNKFNAPSTAVYVFNTQGSTSALQCLNTDYVINDAANRTVSSIPFFNGFHFFKRISATQKSYVNQNILNQLDTQNSIALPNVNVILFRHSPAIAGNRYLGGLNCFYVGASLTDAEYATLNTAINEYLIGCLFLKYGNDNWGVKMAKSYFLELHNFEKYEAWEVYEFIKRHQSDYIYTPLELSENSGAAGMTDWVDSNADGLADNWSAIMSSTCSIVTGNGFTGNAQRAVENGSTLWAAVGMGGLTFTIGKTYKITGKYRAKTNFKINKSSGANIITFSENLGDAVPFTAYWTCDLASYIYFGSNVSGAWSEIDEISIKEWTESDIVTFNKCLNSGFGLGTDWINPTNGLAQYWDVYNESVGVTSQSIVTVGTNRKQRVDALISSKVAHINQQMATVLGRNYTIYFKYRSNVSFEVGNVFANTVVPSSNDVESVFSFNSSAVSNSIIRIGWHNNLRTTVGGYFEIDEVLIIDNSNSQYYYNVFGSNGLNKTVCDYIMLFKAGGNLVANSWIKTGATLRWNQDGNITTSNTMPAYTRGTNLGIVTVTTTDGWNGVTSIDIHQPVTSVNSYYGNFPILSKIKDSTNKTSFAFYRNRLKLITTSQDKNIFKSFYGYTLTDPGWNKIDLSHFVGGVYSSSGFNINSSNLNCVLTGDVTQFTNEVQGTNFYINGQNNSFRQDTVVGTLQNIVINNNTNTISIVYVGVTGGTSTWNKNLAVFQLVGDRLSTSAVDAQLAVINNYFALNTPIKNVIINLSGSLMGIPTGGANNTDLLGIIAKHVAAGFTATITVRTS